MAQRVAMAYDGAMNEVALTIAGSDPSGGAGIQADLKTFQQHGVYGTTVLTMLTVQNTHGVSGIEVLEPGFVKRQLEAVLTDMPPAAAKTGAMGNAAGIEAVAGVLEKTDFPLVVDPVMVSKHGQPLLDDAAVSAVKERLLPRALLVTPNRHETRVLSGIDPVDEEEAQRAAEAIGALGCANVLVKGLRHGQVICDLLWSRGEGVERFEAPLIETTRLHGSGCVFSAAICSHLALGETLSHAVEAARRFITLAITEAPRIGGGVGPVATSISLTW